MTIGPCRRRVVVVPIKTGFELMTSEEGMPTKELLAEFLNTRSAVTEGQKHRRIFLRLFKSQIRFLSFLVILTNVYISENMFYKRYSAAASPILIT